VALITVMIVFWGEGPQQFRHYYASMILGGA
jgi:hypothetical protein